MSLKDDTTTTIPQEQDPPVPGPSRRINQPLPAPPVEVPTQWRQILAGALVSGPASAERSPKPNIIQRHPVPLPRSIGATITPLSQTVTTASNNISASAFFMDPQLRHLLPPGALMRSRQPGVLPPPRSSTAGPSVSPGQGQRPPVNSTSTLAGAQVQLPHPGASNLIRPPNFRPRLPITSEVLDGLMRARAQTRTMSVPATTAVKRQASPTGEQPPTKRSITNTLKAIPMPTGIIWDEEQATNFICPICSEPFKEPHIIPCGDTFCLACINRSLLINPRCPKCNEGIRRENIVPNRALHQLMRKHKENEKAITAEIQVAANDVFENTNTLENLDMVTFFQRKYNDLELGEVDLLLSMLNRKKEILHNESEECRRTLTHDFLYELQQMKEAELNKVVEELGHINSDLATIVPVPHVQESKSVPASSTSNEEKKSYQQDPSTSIGAPKDIKIGERVKDLYFNATTKELPYSQPTVAQRKLKIHSHFPTLANLYLKSCHGRSPTDADGGRRTKRVHLEYLSDALVRVSRYNSFRLLATLSYNTDTLTNANIVSTIEFDKDRDFFAIAGVTKKIRVFEYGSVIAAAVTMQTPNAEIACSSKISCISYSQFFKNKLASSDYDGKVNIYDTLTCESVSVLNEHEKRVWSVDFSDSDPRFLVSGSDDCKVKLWSITQQNSGTTLQANANVCCVKFVPGSSYTVACGSADHSIHHYDFRQPKGPLKIFEGHNKAVSYVQFASKTELVSASTDGHLKLWDLNGRDCVRSYVGHINDKNFVGLTTDGNYIACGSEDNSIYIYYKDITSPLLSYKFENYRSMINPARQDDVSCEFVSAVAWRRGSPVVVAANSQGIIKVLELI